MRAAPPLISGMQDDWRGRVRQGGAGGGPGQFAVRGGILDIYPITGELPVRVELWGDEVDSIRTFDVESQRSIENLEQVHLSLRGCGAGGERVSFLDYFPRRTRSSTWTSRSACWRRGIRGERVRGGPGEAHGERV